MRQFPGRTLEELDDVNWPRLMRAVQADEVKRIEELRDLHMQKKTKPTKADWKKIQSHDDLYRAATES